MSEKDTKCNENEIKFIKMIEIDWKRFVNSHKIKFIFLLYKFMRFINN